MPYLSLLYLDLSLGQFTKKYMQTMKQVVGNKYRMFLERVVVNQSKLK
ncbi:hypothetical protein ACWYRQ_01165 [Clostridioides difficile]